MTYEIWKCRILKFDFLKKEKIFLREITSIFSNLTSAII